MGNGARDTVLCDPRNPPQKVATVRCTHRQSPVDCFQCKLTYSGLDAGAAPVPSSPVPGLCGLLVLATHLTPREWLLDPLHWFLVLGQWSLVLRCDCFGFCWIYGGHTFLSQLVWNS